MDLDHLSADRSPLTLPSCVGFTYCRFATTPHAFRVWSQEGTYLGSVHDLDGSHWRAVRPDHQPLDRRYATRSSAALALFALL